MGRCDNLIQWTFVIQYTVQCPCALAQGLEVFDLMPLGSKEAAAVEVTYLKKMTL